MRRVTFHAIIGFLVSFQVVNGQQQTCSSGDIRGVIDGNVTLGFMFPFRGSQQDGSSCSDDVVYQDNIQLLEAARFAIQNSQGVVPGVPIGLEAYDTCASSKISIDRAVSFLADRLFFVDQEMSTCPGSTLKSGMLIGGGYDTVSSLGTFLSDAHLPHIGFDTTLSEFTKNDRYSYYARALPSDDYQALAITNLIETVGWNYVATFHSENPADVGALEAFKTAANRTSICISASQSVKSTDVAETAFNSILRSFLPDLKPRVVVLFMPSDQLVQFFQAVGRTTGTASTIAQQIQWIVGSRGVADPSVLTNVLPVGTLGVRPVALTPDTTQDFDNFFKALTPDNHDPSANPWFKTFWQEAYQCNLDGNTKFPTICTDEHVQTHISSYQRNPYVPAVLDSVKIFTEAIKSAHVTLCAGTSGLCPDLQQLSADSFYKYVVEVSTIGTANQQIRFRPSGDLGVNTLTIVNCKTAVNERCTLQEVGSWEDGNVRLSMENVELWSNGVSNQTVESTCGYTCLDPVCITNKDALDREVYLPGDIILAGMFNIHPTPNPAGGDCGTIDEIGVQRLEAMLYALDMMNQDDQILPGLNIGMEGIDTCGINGRAGHQALQLISKADFKNSGSGEREGARGNKEHLYAIVGPDGDDECKDVSDVLQVYNVPMVAYAAGSADLSNSYFYPNFARVLAPATNQIAAILGAIYTNGWFYIQAIHSSSQSGWNGVNVLKQQAPQRSICLTQYLAMPSSVQDSAGWDTLFGQVNNRPDAKVIVIIADDPAEYRAVMDHLIARDMIGNYYLIATDGWPMQDEEFTAQYKDHIKGVTAVGKLTRSFPDFQDYFTNLDPLKNTRNPWFQEYWMNKFNCKLPGTDSELAPCTGNEMVSAENVTDIHIADVVDAVYAVGKIIHNLRVTKCPGVPGICQDAIDAGGEELFNFLRTIVFNSVTDDRVIKFDFQGNGDTEFEVFNYQEAMEGSGFSYTKVGSYRTYTYLQQGFPLMKVYDSSGSLIDQAISECTGICADCKKTDKGKVAEVRNGDAYIGGFFKLHELAENEHDCTDDMVEYNMQYLEAFMYAIDQVNNDPDVLPNLDLGGVAFDTCGSEKRARRDAANFISATVEYRSGYPQNRVIVSGIIGEQTSDVTLALADVVTPLQVPQVSYAATTTALDNNETYPFFQRTVASDSYQADALIDLLIQMKWRYISVVYSDDEYGNDIYSIFVEKAKDNGICIAMSPKITAGFGADDFQSVVRVLRGNPQANAVLLLTSDIDTRDLLTAANTIGVNDLQWVGTDTWGSRDYVTEMSTVTAKGALTLQFRQVEDPNFKEYLATLNPYSNVRNPWWKLFISRKYECNLYGYDVPQDYDSICAWNVQSALADEPQEPEVNYIILAVKAFATGLHEALQELCPEKTNHLCNEVIENSQVLQDKVRAARVPLEGGDVFQFDEYGNGPARYDILNYQMTDTGGLNYTKVGSWDSGTTALYSGQIKFYNGDQEVPYFSVKSECTGRCPECKAPTKTDDYIQVEGQLQIPGLFALHETGDHLSECGDFRLSGLLNLEAMLYAVDRMNNDPSVLPGVTLGTTSFDTCQSSARAARDLSSLLSGSHMSLSTNQIWSSTVGVVGPEADDVTMSISELTSQYKYTQISYGPGDDPPTPDSYLYRNGPFASDNSKAMAIVDILVKYNWKYVSVVYSIDSTDTHDGRENANDARAFIETASAGGICIATQQLMSTQNASDVLDNLLDSEPSDVIVTFLGSNDINALQLQLVVRGSNARHLTWILAYPDNLSTDGFIIGGGGDSAIRSFRGALAIKAQETIPTAFSDYVKRLRVANNQRNPWFQEHIETSLMCSSTESTTLGPCPLDASISDVDIASNGALVGGVIDSVHVMALGMHSLLREKCPGLLTGMCAEFLAATADELRVAIKSVSLTRNDGSTFRFSEDHTVLPTFDVWNYQGGTNGFVKVGSWQPGNLDIMDNQVRLFKGGEGELIPGTPSSECSDRSVCEQCFEPTTLATTTADPTTPLVTTKEPTTTPIRTTLMPTTLMPTTLKPTTLMPTTAAVTTPKPVVVPTKPDKQTEKAVPTTRSKTTPALRPINSARIGASELTSTWFYVIIVFAAIGIALTLVLIALVVIRWNEPIAQAMSPFLLLMVLVGLLKMFFLAIVFAVPVSLPMCGMQRLLSGLGFAMCHAGLFLMTVRLYRMGRLRMITGNKVSFIQTGSQIVLFVFLSAFQLIVGVEWLILKPPGLVDKGMPTANPKISGTPLPIVEQECAYTTSELQASFIWVYVMLLLTLGVALVARRRINHMVSMSLYQIHTILLANIGSVIVMIIWILVGAFADRDLHRPSISVLATINAYIVLAAIFIYRARVLFYKDDPYFVPDDRNIIGNEYGMGAKKMDVPGFADASHVSFENPIAMAATDFNVEEPNSNGSNGSST